MFHQYEFQCAACNGKMRILVVSFSEETKLKFESFCETCCTWYETEMSVAQVVIDCQQTTKERGPYARVIILMPFGRRLSVPRS